MIYPRIYKYVITVMILFKHKVRYDNYTYHYTGNTQVPNQVCI